VKSLSEYLQDQSYAGYAYAYPHKTAYRPLTPRSLQSIWKHEDKNRLFLYVHLPFCEMRCGFCNLFTSVNAGSQRIQRTLEALARQSATVAQALRPGRVVQAALGGGTPTMLSEPQLSNLFDRLDRDWPWHGVPLSVEASPGTISPAKLQLLKQRGVTRLSLGIQSFHPADLEALGRPQAPEQMETACQQVIRAGFPVFNLDLIYGCQGQDSERWEHSLRRALHYRPQELYLYPLYVGKLTGLDRQGRKPAQVRRELYDQARSSLLKAGYEQVSMRFFRLPHDGPSSQYCCQEDAMVGLGPGARSYTRALHYSSEYAVGQSGVRAIIDDFACRDYTSVDYGVELDASEQRLRRLLKSLLRVEGLSFEDFSADAKIQQLLEHGLAEVQMGRLRLTPEGLAHSDSIGPWLYSEAMTARMREFEFR